MSDFNVLSGTEIPVTKMGQHPMLNKAEVVDNCLTHLHVLSFSSSYEIGKGTELTVAISYNEFHPTWMSERDIGT